MKKSSLFFFVRLITDCHNLPLSTLPETQNLYRLWASRCKGFSPDALNHRVRGAHSAPRRKNTTWVLPHVKGNVSLPTPIPERASWEKHNGEIHFPPTNARHLDGAT